MSTSSLSGLSAIIASDLVHSLVWFFLGEISGLYPFTIILKNYWRFIYLKNIKTKKIIGALCFRSLKFLCSDNFLVLFSFFIHTHNIILTVIAVYYWLAINGVSTPNSTWYFWRTTLGDIYLYSSCTFTHKPEGIIKIIEYLKPNRCFSNIFCECSMTQKCTLLGMENSINFN